MSSLDQEFQRLMEQQSAFIQSCLDSENDLLVDSLEFDFTTGGAYAKAKTIEGRSGEMSHFPQQPRYARDRVSEPSQNSKMSLLPKSARVKHNVHHEPITESGLEKDGGHEENSFKKPNFDIESKYGEGSQDSFQDKEASEPSHKLGIKDPLSSHRQPKSIIKDHNAKNSVTGGTRVKFEPPIKKEEGSDPSSQFGVRSKTNKSHMGHHRIQKLHSKESQEVSNQLSLNNLDDELKADEILNPTHGSSKLIGQTKPQALIRQTSGYVGPRGKMIQVGSSKKLLGSRRNISVGKPPQAAIRSAGGVRIRSTSRLKDNSRVMVSQKQIEDYESKLQAKNSFDFQTPFSTEMNPVPKNVVNLPFLLDNQSPQALIKPKVVESGLDDIHIAAAGKVQPGGSGFIDIGSFSPEPRQEMSVEYHGNMADLPVTPIRGTETLNQKNNFFKKDLDFRKKGKTLSKIQESNSVSNTESLEKRPRFQSPEDFSVQGRSGGAQARFMAGAARQTSLDLSESPKLIGNADSNKLITLAVPPPHSALKLTKVREEMEPATPLSLQQGADSSADPNGTAARPFRAEDFQQGLDLGTGSVRGLDTSSEQISEERDRAQLQADPSKPMSKFNPRRQSVMVSPLKGVTSQESLERRNVSGSRRGMPGFSGAGGQKGLDSSGEINSAKGDSKEIGQSPQFPVHKGQVFHPWNRAATTGGSGPFPDLDRVNAIDRLPEASFGENRDFMIKANTFGSRRDSEVGSKVSKEDKIRGDLKNHDGLKEKSQLNKKSPFVMSNPKVPKVNLDVDYLEHNESIQTSMSMIPFAGYAEHHKQKSFADEINILQMGKDNLKKDIQQISDFRVSRLEKIFKG